MRQPEIVGGVEAEPVRVVAAAVVLAAAVVVAAEVPALAEADGEAVGEDESLPPSVGVLSGVVDTIGDGSATAVVALQPVTSASSGMPSDARTRTDREPRLYAMITSPVWIPCPTVQFAASRGLPARGRSQQADRGGHGA
jgi:hypothetical protein